MTVSDRLAEASSRGPLTERNRLIKENRVAAYTSPNLALGMVPVEFGAGTSRWVWRTQPAVALNPFGTLQGGYLTVFIDELLATAVLRRSRTLAFLGAQVESEGGQIAVTASSTWAVMKR